MQLLWKTVWHFLKKLNIELPYNPASPFIGICPEKKVYMSTQKLAQECLQQHYS